MPRGNAWEIQSEPYPDKSIFKYDYLLDSQTRKT